MQYLNKVKIRYKKPDLLIYIIEKLSFCDIIYIVPIIYERRLDKMSKPRIGILILALVVLITSIASGDVLVKDVEASPWNYRIISSNSEAPMRGVILYLHGAGASEAPGKALRCLQYMEDVTGPAAFAKNGEAFPPEGYVFICPQGQQGHTFRQDPEALAELIRQFRDFAHQLDVPLIVVGHSAGAIAEYAVVAKEPDIADAWVFLSGKNQHNYGLEAIPEGLTNVMVVYASREDMLKNYAQRDFGYLFSENLDNYYGKDCAFVEETTHNAFVTSGDWYHGTVPLVLKQQFFWDWVAGIKEEGK